MPIVWKKNFKPDIIFNKIKKEISVSPDGKVSFSGVEVFEHIPVIISMLDFPASAESLNHASLVWSALARAKEKLNNQTFLTEINLSLNAELSTKLSEYALITSISINPKEMPKSIKISDASLDFLTQKQKDRFKSHSIAIKEHKISIPSTPDNYSPIRVLVREKSPTAAAQKAINHIDLLRGIIGLYENTSMQISFGGDVPEPINRVRCGGRHTIHTPDGKIASEGIWFEPNFKSTKLHQPENPDLLVKRIKIDLKLIEKTRFQNEIKNSLIRYARAFDESDPNTAFLKLWSALENLTTPGNADYDAFVRRCSFMHTDREYHKQVLEHLREYRNKSVHAGIEGSDARTHCFQLQYYFRTAIHFYKHNHNEFKSLQTANEFLDLPSKHAELQGRLKLIKKAIRFVSPNKIPK